ncbi:MAG: hypothetical protein OCD01_13730 [Fibrobacterales bacterium]
MNREFVDLLLFLAMAGVVVAFAINAKAAYKRAFSGVIALTIILTGVIVYYVREFKPTFSEHQVATTESLDVEDEIVVDELEDVTVDSAENQEANVITEPEEAEGSTTPEENIIEVVEAESDEEVAVEPEFEDSNSDVDEPGPEQQLKAFKKKALALRREITDVHRKMQKLDLQDVYDMEDREYKSFVKDANWLKILAVRYYKSVKKLDVPSDAKNIFIQLKKYGSHVRYAGINLYSFSKAGDEDKEAEREAKFIKYRSKAWKYYKRLKKLL